VKGILPAQLPATVNLLFILKAKLTSYTYTATYISEVMAYEQQSQRLNGCPTLIILKQFPHQPNISTLILFDEYFPIVLHR
jgi:hypothetical protein